MNIGDLIRSKPILIASLFLTLCALILSQMSLFNYLGYEFSAVLGLFAGIALGLSTIALARVHLSLEPRIAPSQFQDLFRGITIVSLLTLAAPLVIISVNALFVKNCSVVEGLGFFLLIPVVSVFYAVALGNFCAEIFRQ